MDAGVGVHPPSRVSPIRGRCGALLLVTLVLWPSPGHAQNREAVVTRLIALTNALGGAFGDEGAAVTRGIQELEVAIAQWDASIGRAERGLAADLPAAAPAAASEMLAAIGNVYVQRGRLADGIRQLSASLAVPDGRARATVAQLLAAAQRAAGNDGNAAQTLRAEWALSMSDPVLSALAVESGALTANERTAAVQAVVNGILLPGLRDAGSPFVSLVVIDVPSGEPVFAPAHYAGAYARFAAGNFDEGLRVLREAIARDPLVADASSQPPAMWKGIAALREGSLAEAIAALQSAVAGMPRSSEAHRALGAAYWADGRLTEARAEFDAAIQLSPSDERAYVALAEVFRESGDDAKAQQTLTRAASAIPSSGQVHWALGRMKERDPADGQAVTEYRLAASSGATIAGEGVIYAAIGRLEHSRLDLDAATAAYEKAIRIQANNAAAHHALGEVLQARDLHEYAVVEFLVAHLLDPRNDASLAAASQSLLALGRNGDAEQAARQALQIDLDNVQARYTLAAVLPRLGRADEGRQQLEEYRRLQERLVAAQRRGMETNGLKLQAQVFSQAGNHAAAVATWQQVMALEGPTAETAVRLARELAAAGQPDAAAAAYEDALRRRPELATQRELVTLLESSGRSAAAAVAREAYERMKRERLRQLGSVQ